jgi:hypothetical protein
MEVYDLTPEQQKAFNRLTKAVKDCEKLKIGFVNVYGTIYAFDEKLVSHMDVDIQGDVPAIEFGYPPNSLKLGGDSHADDQSCHTFILTAKGKKVFTEQNEEN